MLDEDEDGGEATVAVSSAVAGPAFPLTSATLSVVLTLGEASAAGTGAVAEAVLPVGSWHIQRSR